MVPNGDTVLTPGDELVLIGNPGEIAFVRDAMAHVEQTLTNQNDAKDTLHRRSALNEGRE